MKSRQAKLYYATGYSCEQAILSTFAEELGLSLTTATLSAPSVRTRGMGCGAFISGVAVLERMEKMRGQADEASQVERPAVHGAEMSQDEQQRVEADTPAIDEFRRLFLEQYGSINCKDIMGRHRRVRDCLDVIGWTAGAVEMLIEKYY